MKVRFLISVAAYNKAGKRRVFADGEECVGELRRLRSELCRGVELFDLVMDHWLVANLQPRMFKVLSEEPYFAQYSPPKNVRSRWATLTEDDASIWDAIPECG